jgi:hypothetical protein
MLSWWTKKQYSCLSHGISSHCIYHLCKEQKSTAGLVRSVYRRHLVHWIRRVAWTVDPATRGNGRMRWSPRCLRRPKQEAPRDASVTALFRARSAGMIDKASDAAGPLTLRPWHAWASQVPLVEHVVSHHFNFFKWAINRELGIDKTG